MSLRRSTSTALIWLSVVTLISPPAAYTATLVADPQADAVASQNDFYSHLTAADQLLFDTAMLARKEKRFSDAFEIYKQLLRGHSGEPLLMEFASDAALHTDAPQFVVSELSPLVKSRPLDWRAAMLLVHGCAQIGNVECRDEQMSHIATLYNEGVVPTQITSYEIENFKAGTQIVSISIFLAPWGRYGARATADITEADGQRVQRVFLESADSEQPLFAKQNPAAAAQGLRSFSLDGYFLTGTNETGQHTETHITYGFYAGQPSYDVLRAKFANIAAGAVKALSSRTGIPVPPP